MNYPQRSLTEIRREIELVEGLGGSLERLAEVLGCDIGALAVLSRLSPDEVVLMESLITPGSARGAVRGERVDQDG